MQKFVAEDAPPSPRPSPKTALQLILLASACDDDLRKYDTKWPGLSWANTREAVRAVKPLSCKARSLDHDEQARDARPVPHRPKFLSVPGGGRSQPARARRGHVGSQSIP